MRSDSGGRKSVRDEGRLFQILNIPVNQPVPVGSCSPNELVLESPKRMVFVLVS